MGSLPSRAGGTVILDMQSGVIYGSLWVSSSFVPLLSHFQLLEDIDYLPRDTVAQNLKYPFFEIMWGWLLFFPKNHFKFQIK